MYPALLPTRPALPLHFNRVCRNTVGMRVTQRISRHHQDSVPLLSPVTGLSPHPPAEGLLKVKNQHTVFPTRFNSAERAISKSTNFQVFKNIFTCRSHARFLSSRILTLHPLLIAVSHSISRIYSSFLFLNCTVSSLFRSLFETVK